MGGPNCWPKIYDSILAVTLRSPQGPTPSAKSYFGNFCVADNITQNRRERERERDWADYNWTSMTFILAPIQSVSDSFFDYSRVFHPNPLILVSPPSHEGKTIICLAISLNGRYLMQLLWWHSIRVHCPWVWTHFLRMATSFVQLRRKKYSFYDPRFFFFFCAWGCLHRAINVIFGWLFFFSISFSSLEIDFSKLPSSSLAWWACRRRHWPNSAGLTQLEI